MRLLTLVLSTALVFAAAGAANAAARPTLQDGLKAFSRYFEPGPGSDAKAAARAKSGPAGVRIERNIEYGRVGFIGLKLDLYVPERKQERPMPAVVFIHGGGWASGDKLEGLQAAFLARDGYVVASIDYRLAWLAKFPAQIEDSKAAIRWLRANAARWNVDPERIGVWGASAGGHLAMLAGCADERAGLEGRSGSPGVSSRVRAICSYFGPSDLASEFANPLTLGGLIVQFFMGPFRPPRDFAAASPVSHVNRGDPPLLMLHGDKDWLVPIRQSEIMLDAYRRNRLNATLVRVRNADHGFLPKDVTAPVTPNNAERERIVRSFFDRHLRGIVP